MRAQTRHARTASLVLVLAFFILPAIAAAASHSKSTKISQKTVHVRTYTRKNGTVVHEHCRRPPSEATAIPSESSEVRSTVRRTAYRKDYAAPGYALPSVTRDSHGRIKRSHAAKEAFQRANPCPANGATKGGCKGYVIDHISPLECGGADAPSNMQWQTIADGKAKDKTESYCR